MNYEQKTIPTSKLLNNSGQLKGVPLLRGSSAKMPEAE